ncbi:head decoration protein [Streptomyces sp. NEAU-H3]|uniref:head decoration protein n=1 Tax=Streptomyces sp. NEAU-H3 TaxID=2720636 RepID=UPI00143BC3A0|nr:head decoration protein [Streptomyces sp. NEAU-H3]NJA56741.1 head decoration protein [Streptomyces sp. NEAU-H3]
MPLQFLTGADVNGQRIVNLGDPSAATDAVTKQYVDNRLLGLVWKQPARAATTGNGTLATAYANGQSLDGVTLTTGDRILIKDQTTGSENGIYVVAASGAPARAQDAAATAELHGAAVYVTSGTVNGDHAYTPTTENPVLGTASLAWAQFGGGSLPTAGAGLTLTGSTLAVGQGTGLTVDADTVGINTSVVARHYAAAVGDGSATSIPVTHNLGTKDVSVSIRRVSDDKAVLTDWTATDVNTVTVQFGAAPSAGQYRVVVVG